MTPLDPSGSGRQSGLDWRNHITNSPTPVVSAPVRNPFDRLIHDRKRTLELLGFDYSLEIYKPAARRRWGYYALPILHGERLVGKLDATADRPAGVLRVNAIHQDQPFTKAMSAAVDKEIAALARWLQLDLVRAASR